jgi:voltage-gated potassium channel
VEHAFSFRRFALRRLGDAARIVTIVLVLAGISIFAYIGSLVVEAVACGVIGGLWAERRRRRAIEALRHHYIICGFGRVCRRVAAGTEDELRALEQLFVPRETLAR